MKQFIKIDGKELTSDIKAISHAILYHSFKGNFPNMSMYNLHK